jgi:hypothetical protein
MPDDDDNDPVSVAFKALDKFIKIAAYIVFINYAFDFIITLPPHIANQIFDSIFKKLGL